MTFFRAFQVMFEEKKEDKTVYSEFYHSIIRRTPFLVRRQGAYAYAPYAPSRTPYAVRAKRVAVTATLRTARVSLVILNYAFSRLTKGSPESCGIVRILPESLNS